MPTERELMLAGRPYLAADPELAAMRVLARQRTARLNALPPAATADDRSGALGELFGAVGPGCWVEPPFRCDYGAHTRLGANVYLNFDCVILDCGWATLGDGVKLGPGVHIYTAFHPTDPETRRNDPRELAAAVHVGNNTRVGGRAVILPGARIGDGAVVGAGSVVTRPVPAGALAVGCPARVVRDLGGSRADVGRPTGPAVDSRS